MKKIALLLTCLLVMAGIATAQTTVKGVITYAEDNEPVVGASVFVKGTSIGTVTDVDGKYTLTGVPSNASTLVISCIGLLTEERPVAAVVNVALSPDSESLEEAVVTIAYGAAKRSSLTGAISSVNSDQLINRPSSSVTSALEGTVSGIQVNNTYGAPGSSPSIRIRGVGTVNGSTSPLYVLDGVPFGGNITDLNPADIESISVLKDAASAALYGNRASNGVILITSKQGKQGRVSVNLDVKQGVYERGIKEYELANDREFMELEWMNLRNYRMTAGDDAATAASYASNSLIDDMLYLNIYNKPNNGLFTSEGKLVPDAQILNGYVGDLDWYEQGIRKGYRQEYNVSASAGTDKSDYYFSLGYLDENGYVTNSGFDRITARTVVNVKPTDWFKTGLNLSASHQNYENTNGNSDGSYTNLFMYARNIAPIYPVHLHNPSTGEYVLDAAGNKQYDGGFYTDPDGVVYSTRNQYADRHVLWENELNSDTDIRNTLQGTAYADIYFLKDFTFTVKGNLSVRNNDNRSYSNAQIGDGKGNSGRASQTSYIYKNYTVQEQLSWNHQFGDHSVSALLGHENYWYNYLYEYGYKTSQIFPGTPNFTNFTEITSLSGYGANYRTESYLSRVRYNYQDKYNVEASFRRDGSSRFATESRWGNFWSVGANWMISREPFMQQIEWVNSLKLRADYGEVGNDAGAGYYGYMALYTSNHHNNLGAYYLSQLPNDELRWETSQSWGIGIESRLFNRLNLNIDYYDKRNKDLIFDVYQPLSAGATSSGSAESTVTRNIGIMSNHGFEIEADVDIVRTRDWRVNLGANATFNRNKVVKLPEQNKDGIISGTKKIMEGKDIYSYYLYTFAGVDQMTGQSMYKFNTEKYYITSDGTENGTILAGSAEDEKGNANTLMDPANYYLINGEYYVNNTTYALREFHGSANPNVYGSFNLNTSWKNFTVSAIFTYSLGSKVYDSVYAGLMGAGGTPSSIHKDALNSWTGVPAGMTETSADRLSLTALPEFNYQTSTYNNSSSSRWLISGNYLVFKNLAISYALPKSVAKALDMQGINLSLSCENVFTMTARQGMNPQQSFSGGQSNALVTARVMTGAVSFRF